MSTHILFDTDARTSHRNRAFRLAAVTAGATTAHINMPPTRMPRRIDTLTLWGHGDMARLCGKTPEEMATLIKAWKSANSSLKTVELITCDVRHFRGNEDSYANLLKLALRRGGILSNTRGITLKGMPVSVGGIKDAHSILLADWQSGTWVYITAPGPSDDTLGFAKRLILFDERNMERPDGTDVASLANKVLQMHPRRDWSMSYGTFTTLRSALVPI